MEIISALLVLAIFWFGLSIVIKVISTGADYVTRGVKKAVTGRDTYFGPGELRLIEKEVGDTGVNGRLIQFRGAIPNKTAMDLGFIISAFDSTEGDDQKYPVISLAEGAMEPNTVAFQLKGDIGRVSVGNAFTDWIQLGAIVPAVIQPPYSGVREITVVMRFVDTYDPPKIRAGYTDDAKKTVGRYAVKFSYNFSEKGYKEAEADREQAQALALKFGVCVAMADGELADKEGDVLKAWMKRQLGMVSGARSERLKEFLNETLRSAVAESRGSKLSLSDISTELQATASKREKYEAIELALDVMAADGIADPGEVVVIREMASALHLDMAEIEQMREKVTLNLSASLTTEEGIESLVGLDPNWPPDVKKRHLRVEFQKWSNRLNALPEGEERNAAQDMLENIAALRKKYGEP